MKQKEDFYREIDIFSKGASGFSPFIVDIMRGIEREFGGIEKEYLDYISEKFGKPKLIFHSESILKIFCQIFFW